MPVAGRKPKDGPKRNRMPSAHEWTEVPDVPYEGPRPSLAGRPVKATRQWWETISTMPHCVLWRPSDWQFALDTAVVHTAFSKGDMARAAELRQRERQMGTTADARMGLRIRYVPLAVDDGPGPSVVGDASVTSINDRRQRLAGAP